MPQKPNRNIAGMDLRSSWIPLHPECTMHDVYAMERQLVCVWRRSAMVNDAMLTISDFTNKHIEVHGAYASLLFNWPLFATACDWERKCEYATAATEILI